jgi:competence protein ComEA
LTNDTTYRDASSASVEGASLHILRELRDWLEELACRAGVDTWPVAARRVGAAGLLVVAVLAVWRWGFAGGSGVIGPAGTGTSGAPPGLATASTSVDASVGPGASGQPTAAATVTVHIVGAVRRPGVYELAGGSRVRDAADAAGGLLGNADQAAVNLARALTDGEQIVVPVKGQGGGGGSGAAAGAGASGGNGGAGAAGGKVNLNTASVAQLDALPGVGPSTAQKIVADRTENGPFRTAEDLMRVPGIGPKKFDSLKDLVTVR